MGFDEDSRRGAIVNKNASFQLVISQYRNRARVIARTNKRRFKKKKKRRIMCNAKMLKAKNELTIINSH